MANDSTRSFLTYGPDRVAKVTGMMLEMNNTALMDMLEDESKLWATADQAIEVLDGVPPTPSHGDDFIMGWEPYKARRQKRADSKRAASKRCWRTGCDADCK